MDITGLIIQLVSGAVCGNAAGAAMKKFSLGTLGNSIVGIIGGGIGRQLLGMLTGDASAGQAGGGTDIGSIIQSIAGGGVGGGILMAIVGMLKQKMGKTG